MVSTRRKMQEDQASGGCRWRLDRVSLDRKPHFFKIIVSSDQQNQLRIPCKFVRNHGKDLSKWARLTVPDGTVWEVELVKSGEGFWLRRGWDKLMKGFSIGYGYLLLFRYEGNSRFHVIIFDSSATEVEYPLVTANSEFQSEPKETEAQKVDDNGHGKGCLSADGDGDDVSVEIFDHSPIGTTPDVCEVEMTGEVTEVDGSVEILDDSSSRLGKRNDAPAAAADHLPGKETWILGGRNKINVKEAILQKAAAFRSKSPCFMVVMRPSYVSKSFLLRIPLHYGMKYLAGKGDKAITFCAVGSSKKWRARFSFSYRRIAQISSGWDVFVRENHLNVGDVCVFEMIQDCHHTYKVHIFRDEHA